MCYYLLHRLCFNSATRLYFQFWAVSSVILQKESQQSSVTSFLYNGLLIVGIDVVVMPATPRDSPVTGVKPKIQKKPEDLDLVVGETALFEVIVEDRTGVSVSWSKDGKLLFGSKRMKIWDEGDRFFMKITKVEVADESLYEVRVRNEHGEEMMDIELLVNGMFLNTSSVIISFVFDILLRIT